MNFLQLMEGPELVLAQDDAGWRRLEGGNGRWQDAEVSVEALPSAGQMPVRITAGKNPLRRVALRFVQPIGSGARLLGDHWERGYGDMEWMGIRADRALPWYFLASDGNVTHGYGVKTGPNAFCCWLVDTTCVTLLIDVRNGGEGVLLDGRTLEAACVVVRQGEPGEDPFAVAQQFCQMMCDKPRLPDAPVYGGNNWYYAYGISSEGQILRDSDLMARLAGAQENRPFMLIDDGWQSHWSHWGESDDAPWVSDPKTFPDMARLAERMQDAGVRPGMWFRPLLTTRYSPKEWLLHNGRQDGGTGGYILDPSRPEVLQEVTGYARRYTQWGYQLLKHDFSTYDILGRWGNQFGYEITDSGWHFADRSKTTAEIILALYRAIRLGVQDALLIGCNTVSHLSAGLFELQRTGDDTSGTQWERTRRMGVNTLAFRMPQHKAFYDVDADCVGITSQVPWRFTEKWLSLLANSGTPLFVSADPKAMGQQQCDAVAQAFRLAAERQECSRPLDWMDTATPSLWMEHGKVAKYDWSDDRGIEVCAGYGKI